MSIDAPFDGQSAESLEAMSKLATVTVLCNDLFPCRKDGCKRCKKRNEAWQAEIERYDMELENALWED